MSDKSLEKNLNSVFIGFEEVKKEMAYLNEVGRLLVKEAQELLDSDSPADELLGEKIKHLKTEYGVIATAMEKQRKKIRKLENNNGFISYEFVELLAKDLIDKDFSAKIITSREKSSAISGTFNKAVIALNLFHPIYKKLTKARHNAKTKSKE